MRLKTLFRQAAEKLSVSVKKYFRLGTINYKIFLTKLYLKLVFLGFFLTGLQATFIPALKVCSNLFGNNVCDPLGNYVVTFSSFPGYFIVANLMNYWPKVPANIIFLSIFILSVLFYALIGYLIDLFLVRKFKFKGVELFILLVFVLLLITVLVLI